MLLATTSHSWAAESIESTDSTSLSASTELSNEGYFVLNWQTPSPEATLILEQDTSGDFTDPVVREIAGEGAATITGLTNGNYFFRLVEDGATLSNTVEVTVAHHSLGRATGFFLLGLCLFSILVITILRGNKQAGI
ncbi:MAG: hypothetical protein ACE37N_07140 [Pseudohongiellaceae bacterium]|jgi:hypothetical protein